MARAIRAALAEHDGDILAFLPGMAEIRRTERALDRCGADVLPLHGDLPPADQDRALRQSESRRVVLATSIAETSLTVPGVRIVIDGGWRRVPRLDPSTGLTRLVTVRVFPCRRRSAGRARRTRGGGGRHPAVDVGAATRPRAVRPAGNPGGGTVVAGARLRRLGHATRRVEIPGSAAARCADRCRRVADRTWRIRRRADHAGRATHGLARRAPAAGRDDAGGGHRRPSRRSPPTSPPCWRNAIRCGLPRAPADIGIRLLAIRYGDPDADRGALSRIRRTAGQYRRRLRLPADLPGEGDPGRLLAAAFPDRIGQRRGEPGSFRFSGGGGGRMPRTDKLASTPLLVAAALDVKAAARIRLAAPVDADNLPPAIGRARDRAGRGRVRSRVRMRCSPAAAVVWGLWC